jgi:hypothetical protein
MDKTEQCLLQKLIMNLKKKVNKEEANHKQLIKLKIKMMKRKQKEHIKNNAKILSLGK